MMASIGKNMTLMEAVERSIGTKSSFMLELAASKRLIPLPRLSIYPSIVMTESSTIIPSTTMSAAKVTVFRSMPIRYMMAMAMEVQIGTPELAISADFNGKRISMTSMTTIIAMTRSLTKAHTDVSTTLGWSEILVIVTLSGRLSENSDTILSISFPKVTMLFPERISIDMTSAFSPLYSTYEVGVLYLRSIVAISFSLIV